MEKPEVIKQKIKDLQKELEVSIDFHNYELVCENSISNINDGGEKIGIFHIENARKILNLLWEGKKLQFRHGYYGTIDVEMNPQKNRIIVSEHEHIKENNIMNFIIHFQVNGINIKQNYNMENLMVGLVLIFCIIGLIPIIWILIYTFSKSINGKEHIEKYMSEKYGKDWFEEMIEGLKDPEVRKSVADELGIKKV